MFNQNGSNSSVHAGSSASAPASASAYAHTQLDHLSALCNHLEEASACFAAPPSGFYSGNLRNHNLSPEGMHKLPSPCSVMWYSNSDGSDAYQWKVHFLLDDFLEVIEGLFADGRLNTTRQSTAAQGRRCSEVYRAGDFTAQMHSYEPSSEGDRYYYELSYTPATMSSIRMFTLVEQGDLGNTARALERCGIHIGEVK